MSLSQHWEVQAFAVDHKDRFLIEIIFGVGALLTHKRSTVEVQRMGFKSKNLFCVGFFGRDLENSILCPYLCVRFKQKKQRLDHYQLI